MKELIKKIKINRKYFILPLLILAAAVILLPQTVNAAEPSALGTIANTGINVGKALLASPILIALGTISVLVMGLVGALNMMVISFIINIVQYNGFINEPSIVDAWVIVRDLCNMFFILILLVVAFATILRIESYQWKKILPKLLIMAVLINFSRTICGLIIDASQIIMLTFTNAFAAGNLVDMMKMAKYFNGATWSGFTTADWSVLNVVIGLLVGIMFLIISGIVLVVAMSVFLMRIVMLWIYIVLSPLAFLAAAFPAGQKYATQWWSEFVKYIINGPVLAFFIWMALMTSNIKVSFFTGIPQQCFGNTDIMCMQTFMPFILSIGMLLGGLMITQQIGGIGSSIAGKGLDWAKKSPKLLGGGALFASGWAARKLKAYNGVELRPTKIISGIKEALVDKARREEIEGESKSAAALRKGGVGGLVKGLGASRDLTESVAHGFLWHKGLNVFDKDSTIRKTVRAGGLRKDIKKLEEERDKMENINPEKAEKQKQIDKANAELAVTSTPYTYFADQKRNAAIKEQTGKIGDNDNEEDLVAMFNAAVNRGDKETAAAVYITASRVGHANEIIMSQKSTEDVIDDNGQVIIKKGEDLHQSGYGLNALTKQTLIGKLGMSEQEAFNIQSQVSTNAKSIGHFNLAESVGVKNGMLYQRKVTDQRRRSRGELRKVDVEKAVRNFNRLAYGDERNVVDEKGETKRKFEINELGFSNILEYADSISKEIKGRRFQKNAAMNIASDVDNLRNMVKSLSPDERKFWDGNVKNKDGSEGAYRDYEEVIDEIVKYGESVKAGMDRAKKVEELASETAVSA